MTVDVIIIGAGISGMYAARELVDLGHSVVVVERRGRAGGRLRSAPSTTDDKARLDLGATWFWPGEARVATLVERFAIATHRQHITGDALYHEPAAEPGRQSAPGSARPGTTATATGRRIDGNPLDVPSMRFTNGADSLTRALADSLPAGVIRLGFTARAVRSTLSAGYDPGSLSVELTRTDPSDPDTNPEAADPEADGFGGERAETMSARHVILALPPALAMHAIAFEPPLPERLAGLAAVTPVWMGSTTKVVAQYRRPFWRDRGLAGSAISHIGPMRELHDMSGPDGSPAALFGFASSGGPHGRSGPPSEADVINQLAELFGPDAADPEQIIIADWSSDPATSPPEAERLVAYQTYGHDLYQTPAMNGHLHWSSTETATVNPGHIEGALAAAERAVIAINADLTSGSLGQQTVQVRTGAHK